MCTLAFFTQLWTSFGEMVVLRSRSASAAVASEMMKRNVARMLRASASPCGVEMSCASAS